MESHALDLREVRRLAMLAGYGHEVDLAPCEPGSRKAAYLSDVVWYAMPVTCGMTSWPPSTSTVSSG